MKLWFRIVQSLHYLVADEKWKPSELKSGEHSKFYGL
jgi:hypothetical protein